MRNLARRDSRTVEVRQLAEELGHPWAVEYFIRSFWVIVPDPPEAEYIRAPQFLLRIARETDTLPGDCDDAATLAASLLHAIDQPCTLVAIRMPADVEYSHVFCRARTQLFTDGWMHTEGGVDIDPIVPSDQLPIRGYAEKMELEV